MKRNGLSKAIQLVMVGTLVGGLTACGGGGSGSSGSSNTSANNEGTSVGAVTGFGSVYVNGTRFKTDGSVNSDDGISREDQLEKGMVLKIKGDWDDRGEGRADAISYDDTLRGPLASASWDAVASTGQLQMLGQTIALTNQTVFRGATPEQLAANPAGYNVRVSGWRLDDGTFRASYVGARLVGSDFGDMNEAELEGVVQNLDAVAQTFTINGFKVDYTSAVADDDFSLDQLKNGLGVEVEGELNGAGDTLIALEIDEEDDFFDDNDDVEISGDIYDFDAAAGTFRINGVLVKLMADTEYDDISAGSLENGVFVKVEGDFRNNTLEAEEIEGRDGDAELDGVIEQIDLTNEILMVSGVKVQLTASTLIDDDDSDDDRRDRVDDINAFAVGDFVEVEGRQRADYLEAFTVEREDGDDDDNFELEARVDAISDTSVTFMNLEILLNGYSVTGIKVGDEAEVEYNKTAGGEYQLTESIDN
ncbi:DUF5666 domain-containing protein [Marinobacter daepoensis]|uniref:DUF5666 domain-containing protein n=1 Tax=Marinobacter daepoensis TaxID=262077 RepID=UPI000426AB2D|nr:DUF5666 domain-containing protein [Marinobacter daepoensis]